MIRVALLNPARALTSTRFLTWWTKTKMSNIFMTRSVASLLTHAGRSDLVGYAKLPFPKLLTCDYACERPRFA